MPDAHASAAADWSILDNTTAERQAMATMRRWRATCPALDVATDVLEIGALLRAREGKTPWETMRLLFGADAPLRSADAFQDALQCIRAGLDDSLEREKEKNDFLAGVPEIVTALGDGTLQGRLYRAAKLQARAAIGRGDAAHALVGASSFTAGALADKIELNLACSGAPAASLATWYDALWDKAEDISAALRATIERHTHEYSPFEVYVKALYEFLHGRTQTAGEWEKTQSRVYPLLDQYQKDGYHKLLEISDKHNGAFLCDGVGLGKTFIGLMLIERMADFERKRVALIVPKIGRASVWEASLERCGLGHLRTSVFSNLFIFNHTDLQRRGHIEEELKRVKEMADVVLIDEAHHFRNPGVKGEGELQPSRYWRLFDLLEGPGGVKKLFLLTATPVNNKLIDLQHMIELFSRREKEYFKTIGIHSLPGHFRKMETELKRLAHEHWPADHPPAHDDTPEETDLAEAERVLASDDLCNALVVQRSRAYVKKSQQLQGASITDFPTRELPQVVKYDLRTTYGPLLAKVEQAFSKDKPLFALAIYCPLAYLHPTAAGAAEADQRDRERVFALGRQQQVVQLIRTQFLKRFESSARAFECSCDLLLVKLLAFAQKNSTTPNELQRLEKWKRRHSDILSYVQGRQRQLFDDDPEEEADEDIVSPEMLDDFEKLDRHEYNLVDILADTYADLDQVMEFLRELRQFDANHDDKLAQLLKLLKTDPVLAKQKVLIFSEFADTGRYLLQQMRAAGLDAVEQVDSSTKRNRADVIRCFAPYYNGSSSAKLLDDSKTETRILISTDMLSEGLNLQDATRMINYDLHWNPVRLMQRIGRVDRRLDPKVEDAITADHPEQQQLRGHVAYWNFLPPAELNRLLTLYARVTHKTLRISTMFGIEEGKLLTPDDPFEPLRNFNHICDGEVNDVEKMRLELQELLRDQPDLEARLAALPGRVFSGKAHPAAGTRAVFFCYALPGAERKGGWSLAAGKAAWYLYDLETQKIGDQAPAMVGTVRSTLATPRRCLIEPKTLGDIRANVERHIKDTYLKSVQAPVGVKAALVAWMELN